MNAPTAQATAYIGHVPVHELSRPLEVSTSRVTYIDTLLEIIVEQAESIEPKAIEGVPERIRVLAEIAQILIGTVTEELLAGERFLRQHQAMRSPS
jgi:hypothetical protein